MMLNVEEPIDLDRVISDPSYRRDVIDYLNRQAQEPVVRTIAWPSRSSERLAPASIRSSRDATISIVQAKS